MTQGEAAQAQAIAQTSDQQHVVAVIEDPLLDPYYYACYWSSEAGCYLSYTAPLTSRIEALKHLGRHEVALAQDGFGIF